MKLTLKQTGTGTTWTSGGKKKKDEEQEKKNGGGSAPAAPSSGSTKTWKSSKLTLTRAAGDTAKPKEETPTAKKENAADKTKDNSGGLWDRLKEAAEFATDHVYGNSTPANTQTTDDPRKANLLDLTLGSVKRGYVGSRKGQEAYKAMMGKENELEEYTQKLSGSEYNFQPEGLIGTAVSGAAELLGQQVRQWTDPRSLSAAGGAAAMASVAGKAGPQALIPEEIVTVPAMFGIGMKAGSSLSNFEIEAGNAYLEMLENGISEDTAKKIALVVGGGNAALEGLQLDELFKSMKVLQKSGADETVLNRIMRVLIDRGLDVTNETFQETAQEGVTIAGSQAASKLEKGDWQYDRSEVANRLGETALSSALSFGLMNIPGGVRGINAAVQDGKRNTTQEGPQMAQEAPAQAEPAVQEDGTMALLRQAAMEMQEKGSVSSRTADRIMGDSTAMEELGVESTASKSQQRRAVKNAVESYVQQDGQDVLRQAATEMQEDAEGTAEGGAQDILRQAAMEMQEEQAQPAPRQDNIREQLRSAARDMGENGTKALAESYDGSADAAEYYAGFAHYYKAGVRGSDMAQVNSQYADSLTEGQKLAAFSAGQNDAAASLAREERAAQYAQAAGEDSGLVFDDYVDNNLEPAMADRINWVAKRLGLRVRYVAEDSITDGAGHTVNAQIRGKEVLVERNNRNPELFLVGHEITHRMQELAPKEYRALRNFAAQIKSVQEDAERKQRLYQGTYEEALDEATADYVGRMLDETTLLDEFIEQHRNDRTLLEKLRDAFRAVVAKLTGAEKKAAQTAEGKLTAALEAAGKQADKLGENKNTTQEGGETKRSIKETQDGRKYVQADRQVIFGNDPESWSYQLEDYINGKIRNGEDVQLIAQDGDVLTLTATSAGKLSDYHTSDGRTMSEQAYERKVNAAAHIDELVTISRRGKKNVVDYNQRHGEMAADGWNYRTAFFRDFDGKYYEVAISVAESADGKVVYNIGQMQERSTPQINGSSAVNSGAQRGNASTHSISGESKDVNTKSSLKEDNLLLPLNDESIEEKKKNLDWDTANRMLDEQEGLSYRFYGNDNPMSRAGYAMFSDDPDRNGSNYGGDNPRAFSVSKEDLTDFSDVQDKLIDARHKTDEAAPWELEDYTSLDDSEFAELFDPDDIVDNAAAWDNEDLVEWFWNNVAEPNEIRGVKTFDGAIAFDPEIIKRNLPAEVVFGGRTRFSRKAPKEEKLNQVGVEYDDKTESVNAPRYSRKTWNESSYVQDRDNAAKAMSEAIGISQKKAEAYIDSVNGIARIIADDQVRLDYEPAPGKSAFVSNAEYGGSIDFSTICKKRRLFTGTFEAIQAALPDTALTAEEFLEIRSMMAEKGYEVSCGLCYVEGSRANMGQYTKQFLERYAATDPDYLPNMAEMNTATGQEKIRREHPEVYEAYEYFMNHYGRLKPTDKALFASQQKPKMYQLSTEYKGEILTKFGKKGAKVEEKNANGGLRLQSFSDFEIVHLIDSMQVIMDMSRVGLAGQAYTKVPDFAWALGDTGLKINLSLIAKGVDSKGKLILDEVEGMAEADAMALRERYSDNVGTILVIFNDQQLLAAMADERIDFIIPFHRSQWKSDQYEAMGLPKNPKDYTPWQNESYLEPVYNKNGKKLRPDNYMPNNYWNFRESGKKNAEAYLKMCAENNRLPKFSYLLDKKPDGSYALKKDGSTDGYWKLLIDFKMYNNDGKGVPQKPVVPEFNMEQAERMLQEYNGGHQKFPAAQDVVDEFVAKYKEKNDYASDPGAKFSRKEGTFGPAERALQEENEMLRERVEYWKSQTRRTTRVTTDKKAVAKAAKDLVKTYGADIAAQDIQGDLQSLYDYLASGYDGKDELTYTEARRRAEKVARTLVENALETDSEMYDQYKDLRDYLRRVKLNVPESVRREIADYGDFRKANMGRLNLGRDGQAINNVYRDLSMQWPEFFDEQLENNPADQLRHMAEVMGDIYTITQYNPNSENMAQAVAGAANEIMEMFFDLPQTKKTFADKQAEKLADLREKNQERVEEAIATEQDTRARQLKKLKDNYAARDKRNKEKRTARELRGKIIRHVNALNQKLLRPNDKQNVPESLRTAVAAMLNSINLESNYTIGEDGKRTKTAGGAPAKRTEAFRKLKEEYAKILRSGEEIVIDPSLFGSEAEEIEGGFDAVIAMGDTKLADMTAEQLATVWQVVKTVEHSVNTAGKVLSQAKYESTKQWADALTSSTIHKRARTGKAWAGLHDLETPYTFFANYGEAGKAIYRMLRDAQDQQQLMIDRVTQAVEKIVKPETVKKLEQETHEFTTGEGKKLTLTTAHIMELYELMKRDQAQKHLVDGGIFQPEIKSAKIRRSTEAVKLTMEDLAKITGTLTAEEMAIADRLQGLTRGLLADYGNEASMRAYGYKKFTEEDYWPIKVAKEGLHANIEKGSGNTRSIKNIGLAKSTTAGAYNPLELGGIFDTFARHAGDMTDYAAWLCPMEDANRLFNFEHRDENGLRYGENVKGLLERVGGEGSQAYWQNLMEDIQNGIGSRSDSPLWNTVSKSIGSFKGAAVGANARVVIQQPTAFFRAAAVLRSGDLAKGMGGGVTKGNGWKKALKYAPIAMRKDAGGFDIAAPKQLGETMFGKTDKVQQLNNKLSAAAGKADAVTWGKLWNACEWAVARKYPNIPQGSQAFYRQTAQQFAEVIDQTQVVDGVLQRSNIMRSSDSIVKQATSFMGEPIMSLNLLLRSWEGWRYEQEPEARTAAKKAAGRAALALVATNVVNALAQSVVDAARDDDEDKKYWERFWAAFTGVSGDEESGWEMAWNGLVEGNVGSGMNPVTQVPFAKDILSLMQGYDVSRTEMEVFSDLIQAGRTAIQSMDGQGKKTRAYAMKGLLAAGAKLFGIPVSNMTRDLWGLMRTAAVETDNIPVQYEMEKAIYNLSNESNKGRYYDIMYRALEQGDLDSYHHIREDLMAHMALDGKSMDAAMRERYNKAVKADPKYTLPAQTRDLIGSRDKTAPAKEKEETFGAEDLGSKDYRAYTEQRASEYRSMADSLENDPTFRSLDAESRDKVLEAAYSLAQETALADNSGGQYEVKSAWMTQADDAEKAGIEDWEYVLFHAAYEMAESTKINGKIVKGESKSDHVREWLEDYDGLTERQREFLWGTVYKSEW